MTRDNGVLAAGVISLAAVLLMILAGLWATTDGFAAWATPGGGGGSTLTAQDDGTPLAGTVVAVNAGVDIDATLTAGVLTINNTRPTATPIPPVPTATPQPTATPSAGGGVAFNPGLAMDDASTPTSSDVSGVPNVFFDTTGSLFPIAGDIYYEPFNVEAPITINRVSLERTDTNPAQICRVGIYTASDEWQPLALEVDFGNLTLAGGVAGWNHLSVSHSLAAGSYLSARICNGAGMGAYTGSTDIAVGMQNLTACATIYTLWRASAPSIGPQGTPFPATPAAGDTWDAFTLVCTANNSTWTTLYRWTVDP